MKTLLKITSSSFLIFALAFMSSCKKDSEYDQQREKLQGKYSIQSATSNQSVDVNLDGTASANLLTEIPRLNEAYLELIFTTDKTRNIYSQFWQNQYFMIENPPVHYDPTAVVEYQNQATVANFSLSDDYAKINLTRDQPDPLFPLPQSVEIIANGQIKVIMDKRLYTKAGWVTVNIEIKYQKAHN